MHSQLFHDNRVFVAYSAAAKHATILVSASVVVTAIAVPFLTAWWAARHPARPHS